MMTKFNVGDKVRIAKDLYPHLIGKEGVITEDHGNCGAPYSVKLEDGSVQRKFGKFLALVSPLTPTNPKKSARITALETQVAELQAKVEALESAGKYPLTERFERESAVESEAMDAILADIERKAKPTPNEQRADVIKRAKAFVADIVGNGINFTWDIGGYKKQAVRASFHVNTEKGAVTALIHGHYSRHLYAKGIAKCDPDDVFNADIGKAIALARALGVEVPTEFVKAVQPTEIVLGHRIFYTTMYPNILVIAHPSKPNSPEVSLDLARAFASSNRILDDSNAVYE